MGPRTRVRPQGRSITQHPHPGGPAHDFPMENTFLSAVIDPLYDKAALTHDMIKPLFNLSIPGRLCTSGELVALLS